MKKRVKHKKLLKNWDYTKLNSETHNVKVTYIGEVQDDQIVLCDPNDKKALAEIEKKIEDHLRFLGLIDD